MFIYVSIHLLIFIFQVTYISISLYHTCIYIKKSGMLNQLTSLICHLCVL